MISHFMESGRSIQWHYAGRLFFVLLVLHFMLDWRKTYRNLKPHADGNIAFCMAVRDQGLDLPEFLIHHYYNIGIKHFYIMDDGSNPPLSSFDIENYYGIPGSAYTITYFNETERVGMMQHHIYNECNKRFGAKHDWIGYFDVDEFIGVYNEETLADILEPFETDSSVGAFGINWRMHTSAGLLTRPESARKSFNECIFDDQEHNGEESDNRHIKSLVKPSAYSSPMNPHKFNLLDGSETVGEDGEIINSYAFRQPISRNRIGLHHYAVKSKTEYEEKRHRGNALDQPKGDEFWNHVESIPHVQCLEMTHWDV